MKKQRPLFAGLEGGGTKFVCAVAAGPEDIRAQESFPTTTPEETIGKAISFFKEQEPFTALGIATFGPCDLDPRSPAYGHITSTPKPGWQNVNLLGLFRRAFAVPVGFDTDVNVAALGEWKWGAGKGLETVVYMTVGNRNRGRRDHKRPDAAWFDSSGDGTYPGAPGFGRYLFRKLSLPWGLSAGSGCGTGDRGPLGKAGRGTAARPPRLELGGILFGPGGKRFNLRAVAPADHPRRRRHAPAPFVSADSRGGEGDY